MEVLICGEEAYPHEQTAQTKVVPLNATHVQAAECHGYGVRSEIASG
jgi:hypothetical protein